MTQPNQEERAFHKLTKWQSDLTELLGTPFNEADTRARFIDTLLFEVLGWRDIPSELIREWTYQEDKQRYAIDYLFTLGKPVLVVEAKRHLFDFGIPDNSTQTTYRLNGIIQTWAGAWSAITQARKYCDDKGARYALVTNGHSFIAFQAISERGLWQDGTAVVLRTPQAVRDNFSTFWACLSHSTITADYLASVARTTTATQLRERVRTGIPDPGAGFRNQLHDVMQNTLGSLLLDIPEPTQEFLAECYCTSVDSLRLQSSLDGAIVDPIPAFRTPISPVQPGHRRDSFDQTIRQITSNSDSQQLIVVMGGVGVGKTIFLQWYLNIHLPSVQKQLKNAQGKAKQNLGLLEHDPIIVWLDFGQTQVAVDTLHQEVVRKLVAGVEQKAHTLVASFGQLKEIFRTEIDNALMGELFPYKNDQDVDKKVAELIARLKNDSEQYLKSLITYLQNHCKRRVIVVLDNMDQKSPQLQTELYQTAQHITRGFHPVVIISLRESTYQQLARRPQFNAFSPLDFHIRAQPLDIILQRRLEFAAHNISLNPIKYTNASGIEYTISDVARFIEVLKRSLIGEDCDLRTLDALTRLTNGNLREQLRLLHVFLVSGQTKIDDYFWTYLVDDHRTIPFHEVLHSLILEDRKLFLEDHSEVFMNIFEASPSPAGSHFTTLRLLSYFQSLGQTGELRPGDFIPLGTISDQFQSMGLNEDDIWFHVRRACQHGLIQPSTADFDSFARTDEFALTRCGKYYLSNLYFDFSYIAAIAIDTSISFLDTVHRCRQILARVLAEPKLPLRVRAEISTAFVTYLADCESNELRRGSAGQHVIFGPLNFSQRMIQSVNQINQFVNLPLI